MLMGARLRVQILLSAIMLYILLYYTIYIYYYIILLCLCRSLLITSMGHIKLTDFGLSKVGLINSK